MLEEEQVQEEKVLTKQEVREKSAKVVSTSVFIYIAAVALFVPAVEMLKVNETIVIAAFLLSIAWATVRIIRHYMSIPKFEKTEEEKKEDNVLKQINGIVGAFCVIIYFIVSFLTNAWHITWVIFIIDGLICQIIKLIFMLKGEKADEE